MHRMNEPSTRWPRFQFSTARLMACTFFVALAAWAATLRLPMKLNISTTGERDLLPLILAGVLLAAAIGSLVKGKSGAKEGAKIGCFLLFISLTLIVPILVGLTDLVVWVWRLL